MKAGARHRLFDLERIAEASVRDGADFGNIDQLVEEAADEGGMCLFALFAKQDHDRAAVAGAMAALSPPVASFLEDMVGLHAHDAGSSAISRLLPLAAKDREVIERYNRDAADRIKWGTRTAPDQRNTQTPGHVDQIEHGPLLFHYPRR